MLFVLAQPIRQAGRTVLRAIAITLVSSIAFAAQAKDSLTVVTGYSDDFAQTFEAAFEAMHPDVTITMLHKGGREAMSFLAARDHGGADVYWAASGNFSLLRKVGAFATLTIDRKALPGTLGGMPLSDPSGAFEGFEVAGYGLAYGPKAFWAGKAAPQTWADAAKPDLEGKIIMPTPHVGFAAALYEIILQSEGWEKGWALLSEIAGNAALTDNPHGLDAIEIGKAALFLAIDFHPLDAAAKGQPIAIAYPQKTAFLPAYVAELANAPHPQAAKAFIDFLLSQDGQKLLLKPGIDRHPVRPDAYPAEGVTNPFTLPATALVAFDPDLAQIRRNLDAALFTAALATPHDGLVALWRQIHAAEAQLAAHPDEALKQRVTEARKLAGFIPISQKEAQVKKFLAQFSGHFGVVSSETL
ncbi:MAG: ABC transporter substrate-binding protein [Methylovirgula sp.]